MNKMQTQINKNQILSEYLKDGQNAMKINDEENEENS